MESQNLLGIHIRKNTATVICLNPHGKADNVLDCFSVVAEDPEQPAIPSLASKIAAACEEKGLSFGEVAVAVDCSLFMQHNLQSEFKDIKQISSTIRFDTEEALATDISEMALTFEIDSTDQNGSNITVFTSQKKVLSEILLSLQQHNLDPITIKPDVNCLTKLIFKKNSSGESFQGTLFGMISDHSGYMVAPNDSDDTGLKETASVRTFLVGAKQNRTELLSREVLITTALFSGDKSINSLKIFDSAGLADLSSVTERTGIVARPIEWFGETDERTLGQQNQVDRISFAIAYGAALSLLDKEQTVNFRDDFSPYQGKKIKTQKALKVTAISVSLLLIAAGLYFQMNLFSLNRYIKKSRAKFESNYKIVMPSSKALSETDSAKTALRKLKSELSTIKSLKEGRITEGTDPSSKLTLVLEALNKCAKQTDLNIKEINITEKNISLSGDTSSTKNTEKLFDTLISTGLAIKNINERKEGNRDVFSASLEPASGSGS